MAAVSVSQLNNNINTILTSNPRLTRIEVTGEASNITFHKNGHLYFTLKDAEASIGAVLYDHRRFAQDLSLKTGDEVVVKGRVQFYKKYGSGQIVVSEITHSGKGALNEKYERLRVELQEMGMFDECYKQPIPQYVKRLGVVTAPTGAAIRDIIRTARNRFPGIEIVLYPALVQGDMAPASIVKGIQILDGMGLDCIIVGRGGGSLEDLWAFNERIVAQAVFDCATPVISGVGHESDTTITDWVADLRAATPTAAAVAAVFDYEKVVRQMSADRDRLSGSIKRKIYSLREYCDNLKRVIASKNPETMLGNKKMRLTEADRHLRLLMAGKLQNMKHALSKYDAMPMRMEKKLSEARQRLQAYDTLPMKMEAKITDARFGLSMRAEHLEGLSPLLKLSQGYSLTEDAKGRVISSVASVKKGDFVRVNVKDGHIDATVDTVFEKKVPDGGENI